MVARWAVFPSLRLVACLAISTIMLLRIVNNLIQRFFPITAVSCGCWNEFLWLWFVLTENGDSFPKWNPFFLFFYFILCNFLKSYYDIVINLKPPTSSYEYLIAFNCIINWPSELVWCQFMLKENGYSFQSGTCFFLLGKYLSLGVITISLF